MPAIDNSTLPKHFAIAFWAMVLIAPLPGLATYLAWIGELEQYGYVFPLLMSLVALVLFRWDYQFRMPGDAVSLAFVALAVATTLMAAIRTSPWLSSVAFSFAVIAWLHTHRSADSEQHRLTYLSLLLLMLVRLPLNLDLSLATGLQHATSRVSSYLLDALGVTHYLRGNVIELPGGTLFVEEACSGVQSLFTILFLVCLWIVFRRRPLVTTPAYLVAGTMWAMVMNVIRITSIAVAQEWYATDLSEGRPHEILGWICLAGAVIMMLSTDRLFRVLFYPVAPDESGHLANPMARLWNWSLSFGIPEEADSQVPIVGQRPGALSTPWATALMVVVLLFSVPSLAMGYRVVATKFASTASPSGSRPLLWEPDESLMNATQFASLVTNHQSLRNANSKQLGNHADVWTVVIDGIAVRIAVSQPYPEWHDMCQCYSGNGWQINEFEASLAPIETEHPITTDAQPDQTRLNQWDVSYAEMVRDTGDFGTLMFCGLTDDGTLLSQPMAGFSSILGERMKDRTSLGSNIIMLQLWTESQNPLLPDQLNRLHKLFDSFRSAVISRLRSRQGKPKRRQDLPQENQAGKPKPPTKNGKTEYGGTV